MNRKPTILRHWLATLLAAVLMAAAPDMAWGQTDTDRGVRVTKAVDEETDTKVTKVTVTTATSTEDTNNPVAGQIITAKEGRNVTVVTAGPRQKEGKMQVAKVKVTKITDIKATGITVTSAGNVTTMNGNATLQMTANFDPTYTDDKTVEWSVAPASGTSPSDCTINENGLLTAGTTQGDVIVTATATNGTATTDDDKTDSKTITITTIPLTADMITVATATYNGGNPVTPTVTVNDGTSDLVQGTDFEIVSWSDNVYVGTNTASVTVTGMGAYTGSIVKTFSIAKGNQSPSINDRHLYAFGMSCTLSGSYNNTDGQFQLQINDKGTWKDVPTVTQIYQGIFEVYTDDGKGNQYRLKISGNDNWNDYTSGNLF